MTAAGLTINDLESELYVLQRSDLILQNFASASVDISLLAQSPTSYTYHMLPGSCIPIVVHGIKVLGVPLGDAPFCAQQVSNTVLSIQSTSTSFPDLRIVTNTPSQHCPAVYCCNTRITYFLCALPLTSSQSHLPDLNALFDHFIAVTLSFQDDYAHSLYAIQYAQALQQARQGIPDGGFGLTSASLRAPPASYVTNRDFCQWYSSLAVR